MTLPPGWAPRQPEHQPGVIPLRPLAVGDLFGGMFASLRQCWRPLLAIVAAVGSVAALLALPVLLAAEPMVRAFVDVAALDGGASTADTNTALDAFVDAFLDLAPWLLLLFFVQWVVTAIVEAGTALVLSRAVLGGSMSSSEVLGRLVRLLPRLVLLGILMATTIGIGLFLCVIPGLLLMFLWFGAPTAVALEHASALESLRRSAHLVSKSFWRVVGLLLLVQLVYGVAIQVLAAPVSLVTSAGVLGSASASALSDGAITIVLLGYFALGLIGLLTYPLIAVARVLEYLDLRMRHEGLSEVLVRASE